MKQPIKSLQQIWQEVPPDYYQRGIKNNSFQKLWHTRKLLAVLGIIQNKPKKILDIGCASGWFLYQISDRYPQAQCTGIDVYDRAIQFGKIKYPSLRLIQADAHQLPFPNKTFDLILCTEVIEHVKNPQHVLKEMQRVLKPGGTIVIEADTNNWLFRLIWFVWTRLRGRVWKDAHLHNFNPKKLEDIFTQAGLVISKKRVFNLSMAVAYQLTIPIQ